MDLAPGQLLDRYRLVEPLGEGGQGAVWRAVDGLRPDTHVALKVVRVPGARAVDLDRLRREARALARLDHPSLVRCHGLFEDLQRDVLGLVLDLAPGTPLSALLRDRRLDRRCAEWLLRHVASALSTLHDAGMVHRDLKPANLVVSTSFFDDPSSPHAVKLIDLGIAAPTGNPRPLTDPGSVIGTVPFMAPEILDPHRWGDEHVAGARRDVFAFGVLAMELLFHAHPTRLPRSSKLADYAAAYAAYEHERVWPPGLDDDPLALLLERSLALRASERAPNGRALCELLQATRVDAPRAETRATYLVRPSRAGPTRPDEVTRPPPTLRDPRSRRSTWLFAASLIPIAGVAAFAAARWSRTEPSSRARPPLAPSPSPPSPVAPTSTPSPLVFADATCGANSVLVAGEGVSFCADGDPVTVRAYERLVGPAPREASWPGGTRAAFATQSTHCAARGDARDAALNCVDWDEASAYCARSGARLPTRAEWTRAMQSPGVHVADAFEWTADARDGTEDRYTCRAASSGCAQANPRSARNDTLVFRCVSDPR